ncbi:polyprotein [Acanthamoeba castellanii str. Neff]|uniref:Polyprotein n=1 Tax=Acanthamoeba castellanii (strain ATCC 30010 / Neff) TaxID=1257118 RepID=L8HCA5_ACACF|nr:polyprotein [Acanthamoeba castellanii str. Neff]ELR23144.1 polyprotein [Acanthamoeba castellanii str. Neff]
MKIYIKQPEGFVQVIYNHQQGTAVLCQTSHVDAILSHYSLSNCKPQHTPMTAGLSLTKLKFTSHKHTALPYCQVVGCLMYLSQAMWPDIAFAVAYLNKFVNSYDETHWTAIKHVIWYLKATSGPFMWSSRAQSTITLSSCKAEYNTLSKTPQQHTTNNHQEQQSECHPLTQDNQQAFHPQTKHIDIKVAHIERLSSAKTIMLVHCLTRQMITDMLTKALPRPKLKELKGLTNLQG